MHLDSSLRDSRRASRLFFLSAFAISGADSARADDAENNGHEPFKKRRSGCKCAIVNGDDASYLDALVGERDDWCPIYAHQQESRQRRRAKRVAERAIL